MLLLRQNCKQRYKNVVKTNNYLALPVGWYLESPL